MAAKKKKGKKKAQITPETDPETFLTNYKLACRELETKPVADVLQTFPETSTSQLVLKTPCDEPIKTVSSICCTLLGKNPSEDGAEFISHYSAVKSLRLWNTNLITEKTLPLFKQVITSKLLSLTYLQLFDCKLTSSIISTLSGVFFGDGTTLQRLNLDYNESLGANGGAMLFKKLKTNKSLLSLSTRYCAFGIGSEEEKEQFFTSLRLFMHFQDNRLGLGLGLQEFVLDGNRLKGTGLEVFSKGLSKNVALKKISFRDNGIGCGEEGKKGLNALTDALELNTTLTNLDLGSNAISEEGATVLVESRVLWRPKEESENSPQRDLNETLKEFVIDFVDVPIELYEKLARPTPKKAKGKGKGKGKKKRKKK
eukprot:snap_masked-scaffold_2-processed-gene-3.18-mRNA-1 protein AED:1.00 eAED:1.00 QI:0/0/0/0/1/1/2/0/368